MSPSDREEPVTALDMAIERTLREIVATDPPARLTARVMARVTDRDGRPRTAIRAWWPMVAGLAAAAAIAMAIVSTVVSRYLPRTGEAPVAVIAPPPAQPTPATRDRETPGREPLATVTASATPPRTPATRAARTPRGAAPIAAPPLEPSIGIAPLAAPDPIALDDIAPNPVRFDPIDMPRIEIPPIDVRNP